MRKPYLLASALLLLAFFFGWRTQQALDAPTAAGDNVARTASTGWQPGAMAPDPPPPPDTAVAVAAVKNRPLFRADRQPFTEAGAGVSARNFEAELSRLSLIGIMSIGDDQTGIVVSKGGARSERWEVKAGDELPGFQVKEVRIEGLAVTAEGREFLLPLYAGPPTAAGGGSVRTEATRKDAAPAQPAAAASPPTPKPGTTPPVVQQAPPARPAPTAPPRYIPGRRTR